MGIETLAIASIGASVGSGILGGIGAGVKAGAESDAYAYKAQVARNNAIIAERNAQAAREAGGVKGQINDLKTKSLISQQLVTQAASGLDVNTGTAVNVRDSTHDVGRLDTLTIIANAGKEAVGYATQAMNFQAEAQLDEKAKSYSETAGTINIMTSLLGSAGSVSDKYLGFKQKGVFA